MAMRSARPNRGPWVSTMGLLVCAGLLFVLAPHVHADASAGQVSKPCSICLSQQNISGLLNSAPVRVDPPALKFTPVVHTEDARASVSDLHVWTERAPPAA